MCLEAMEVSREEAKRILRRLELEAYSSIVSTFRAQGDLNREKKKLLTDLGVHLSISTERHRAEVRRAFSDDRLGAVADCIVGPSTCSEWAAEGRRLVPLMPRLVPQTILSGTATASANAASAANAQISAQVKKTTTGSAVPSTSAREALSHSSTSKPSSGKTFARQSSETVDVEYDSDDNKAKKKRRLSQSVAGVKPTPKMLLNPASLVNKQGTKTASVSTSTMTKVGKQPSTSGNPKATQKLMLPASASQVKLLTKTVSITQTVSQAKTMLNYKTVGATNPAAVKVQTVMSHTAVKPQVKVAVPSLSKNVLVPKSSVSTSPSKSFIGTSPLKAGMTMSQLAAKQRGKQMARFKPVAGTVKYKSVTPATMDSPATAASIGTTNSNITTLTGSTMPTIPGMPNNQPLVRVIQVPSTGGVGITKPMIVMTTGPSKPTASVSSGASILKIPISSTTQTSTVSSTTQAGRIASQPPPKSIITPSPKTVVVSAIVGGTKKVVLSVPAPVTPVQAKPSAIVAACSTAKLTGLSSQLSQASADANKQKADKPPSKITAIPSLECMETSSFLKAPLVTIPKTGAATAISTQVRTRPLQTLLPAPPKALAVTPKTPLSSTPTGRKLPQILPAPVKTTVLVPLQTPAPQTVCTTSAASIAAVVSTVGGNSKAPLVQLMGKTTQPSVVSKLTVAKAFQSSSAGVSLPGSHAKQSLQQSGSRLQTTTEVPGPMVEIKPVVPVSTSNAVPQSNACLTDLTELTEKDGISGKKVSMNDDKQDDQDTINVEETKPEGENNTSSEDDSLLVCSETIDSGAGLHDAHLIPEETPLIDGVSNLTSSPVEPQTKVSPLRPMSDGADNLNKLPTEASAREQVTKSPTENTKKNSGPSNFLEDFFNESDSLLQNLQEKTQIISSGKITTVLEKSDFDKPKGLDQENNAKPKGELEGFKNLAVDDVKDFDAVSSFLQSFVDDKDSSKDSSCSSSLLDFKELPEVNQHWKLDQKSEIPFESKPQKEETKMTLQATPQSGCFSDSLDINEISSAKPNDKPEESSQCEVMKDLFGFEKIQQSNKDDNLNIFPQSFDDCSTTPECSLHPMTFVQSSFAQSSVEQDSGMSSSEQSMRDFSQVSIDSDIIDMLAESSSSADHDHDLTESERLALEAIANVRTSGRKRKPPSILTLSPPRQTSGWIRGAQSLLQKVCSYRGQGRKKGAYSAVSWFLRPVDPNEAPGYFKVIKTPMDFGTIKSKLEGGIYNDYIEFHEDMMLIKTNCLKYNPPGHGIRKDCEEVFIYFETEYEKMLERWEKCHVSPAKKPRTMPKSELATSMSC